MFDAMLEVAIEDSQDGADPFGGEAARDVRLADLARRMTSGGR